MGVVFTGLFAIGLVMFSRITSELHLDHILLGNILGITAAQRMETFVISGIVTGVILLLRRDLMLVCFDMNQAKVLGIRAVFLNYLLLVLLSLSIVVALKAVGIILVIAMLVTPGSIAHLWTDRFDSMLLIAVLSAVISTILGILISYHIDGSTGACIVLTQAAFFIISLFFAPKHGILSRKT